MDPVYNPNPMHNVTNNSYSSRDGKLFYFVSVTIKYPIKHTANEMDACVAVKNKNLIKYLMFLRPMQVPTQGQW